MAIYTIRFHEELSSGWKIFQCRRSLYSYGRASSTAWLKVDSRKVECRNLPFPLLDGIKKDDEVEFLEITYVPSSGVVYEDPQDNTYRLKVGDILVLPCSSVRATGDAPTIAHHGWRAVSMKEHTKARDEAKKNDAPFYTVYFAQPPAARSASTTTAALPDPVLSESADISTGAKRKLVSTSTNVPKRGKTNQIFDQLGLKKDQQELLKKIHEEYSKFQELRDQTKAIHLKMNQQGEQKYASTEIENAFEGFTCPPIPTAVTKPSISNDPGTVLQSVVTYANDLQRRNSELSANLDQVRRWNQTLSNILKESTELSNQQQKDYATVEQTKKEVKGLEAALAKAQATLREAESNVAKNADAQTECLKNVMEFLKSET